MAEITVARESGVSALNAVSSASASGRTRQPNPFRDIKTRPISAAYRAELEEQGVNIRMIEQNRRDERDRRIDEVYEREVRNLRTSLREKYPLGNYTTDSFSNDKGLLAQAKRERAAYNRELNQGVRRLQRLAYMAMKKK